MDRSTLTIATPPFLPDEAKPADADIVSQYPAVERLFRDIMESWLLIDHDTDGEHTQITLPELASDPTAATNTGFVYTKDDATATELFYRDDSGNVVQLTVDGAPGGAFPATTSMLFYQSAAPTGWTKDIASTLNKHGIELVTSTAWVDESAGGTDFDSVFGASKSSGLVTLTAAQSGLPAHSHTWGGDLDRVGSGAFVVSRPGSVNSSTSTVAAANAASGHQHALSLNLKFIKVIRATKD